MKIFILFLLSFSLLYFSGCSDEENDYIPEPPYLSIIHTDSIIVIPSRGTGVKVGLSTRNTECVVEAKDEWCYVTLYESGRSTDGLAISYDVIIFTDVYDGKQPRETCIYFRNIDNSIVDSLKVIQYAYGEMSFYITTLAGIKWNVQPVSELPRSHFATIDWGDGNTEHFGWPLPHTYTVSGNYKITIKGDRIYGCKLFGGNDWQYDDGIAITKVKIQNPCLEQMSLHVNPNYYSKYSCPTIDFSTCPNLTLLSIGAPSVSGINVDKCTKLKHLNIYRTNRLQTINLANNLELKFCALYYTTIQNIDLSNHDALEKVDLFYCNNLIFVNTSGCKSLDTLRTDRTPLKTLSIKSCDSLKYININDAELGATSLNQIYQDLPQGRTWTSEDGSTQQSTIVIPTDTGSNLQIAKDKDWKVIEWW